ncbi:MAG TPA: hypothetical protein VIY47_13550 [Ignavibacteriaceae bacterium]
MKVIFATKMVYVEYERPVDAVDNNFWWPDYLKDPNIKIEHYARWAIWPKPNEHMATFVAFISEEDANYLLIKYSGIEKDFHTY